MYDNTTWSPPLGQRLAAGISYLMFSLFGLFVNLITLYAIAKNRKSIRKYPFFLMATHLIIASMGVFLGQFVVAIPLSFAGSPLYGNSTTLIVLSSGDTFFFNTIFFISILISIERFTILFAQEVHRVLFTGIVLHFVCLFPWLLGCLWVVCTTVIGCPKVFRHDGFYYTYRCNEDLHSFGHVFMKIGLHLGYIGPLFIMLFYLCTLGYARFNGIPMKRGTELHIVWQALLICTFFEMETLLFTFLPRLTHDFGLFAVSLLLDYTLITNSTINALILIFCNATIRSTIHKMFFRKHTEENLTNVRIYEVSSTKKLDFSQK